MRLLRNLFYRVRGLMRAETIHHEIDEETRFHLEMRSDENIRRGLSPEEARLDAERRFGNLTRMKERGYEVRGGRWLETLWQDLRYSLRILLKNPGFTLVAILTLALGIGATTAIFSVVNAVLLRSLPYRDPDRLMLVSHHRAVLNLDYALDADFLEWRDQAKSFEQIAAYRGDSVVLTGSGETERLSTGRVSANLFAILGVAPALGRAFTSEEDTYGGPPVVILSDSLWQSHFGGDPQLIGRTLTLEGQSWTVIGIMPPGFRFPGESDLWLPLLNVAQSLRHFKRAVSVIARLKPGVTPEATEAELSVILKRQQQAFPRIYSTVQQVRVVRLSESLVRNVRQTLLIMFGAVTFVLLIACANVANLTLARSAARQKEMAIRAAVGAGRLRLIRQLLTESLLLSLVGGVAGLLAAKWGVNLLVAMNPSRIARIDESGVDGRMLGFTCVVVVLVGLTVGIFPALHASRTDVNETLKAQPAHRTGHGGVGRMLSALMIAELALALVLLAGAGLMIRSFLRLLAVPTGFNSDGVLTLALSLQHVKDQRAYIQETLDRVRALPGIQSASLTDFLPLTAQYAGQRPPKLIEGRPPFEPGKEPSILVYHISPNYFQTMGIQMRAGRPFTLQDGAEATPVVIINETFARRFFPNEDPIGHRLSIWSPPQTIVGVVGDTRHNGLDQEVRPQIYAPRMQRIRRSIYPSEWLVVRTTSGQNNPTSLSSLAGSIRNQVRAIDSNVLVDRVITMDERLSNSVAGRRFQMLLLGVFAAVALIIATVGIYGIISYGVSQRTHDLGIRMALGAQASDVLRMVVWWGMSLTLIGVALGLAAALALTRVMKSLLFDVSATDPVTFAFIILLLVGVALIASYIPARRATKVDPLQALRQD
jgi:putative ABC transport system permease protein